jgi:hypothetical protein
MISLAAIPLQLHIINISCLLSEEPRSVTSSNESKTTINPTFPPIPTPEVNKVKITAGIRTTLEYRINRKDLSVKPLL